jgi:hypothetical protein
MHFQIRCKTLGSLLGGLRQAQAEDGFLCHCGQPELVEGRAVLDAVISRSTGGHGLEQFGHSNRTPVFLSMHFHDGFAWRTKARTGRPT